MGVRPLGAVRGLNLAGVPLLLLLAGCLQGSTPSGVPPGPDSPDLDASWALEALAIEEGHDHADASHHLGRSTPNFDIIGYDPMVSEHYGTTAAANFCGDAQETADERRLAVVESRSDVGFTLIDVTDASDPEYLGELVMPGTRVYDLAVVPDGRHVVLVTSDVETPPTPAAIRATPPQLLWRSPCAPGGVVEVPNLRAEDPVPRPAALLLVSIEDPSAPVIVDHRPLKGLGHSVFSTIVDGRTWVLASTYATNSGLSNYDFYEILVTPAAAVLNHLSTYVFAPDASGPDEITLSLGHDDGWIVKHPGTGQTLAWLAHWHSGLLVLDLAEPRLPRLIGRWTDYDPAAPVGDTGDIHSAYPIPELWDGRQYTVVGPELVARPGSYPSGIISVLDTTDPTSIRQVAAWTLPHDVEWNDRLLFSTHYLTVVNRTAFVSMYHGGIWALDLNSVGSLGIEESGEPCDIDPAQAQCLGSLFLLPSIGVFMPAETSPNPPDEIQRWFPTFEEVLSFPDGILVTFDANVGVYTIRFDEANPMPAPEPWPIKPADG